ncbi:flagellar biosynthetic protein FliR [Conexibacter sp. DBS9H8]|uniref:flagellar biosynthetic protein FliR n=1 Tax=Conexibacter sp. DBS9H8 TaxID=2937801 RepID=UPI00200CCA8E|nr:flagellar biosynthetic protein FliR [Conexibacter sp. DBS9H8]
MNLTTLAHALDLISAGHVTAFFLVLARITPLFLLAPVFSSKLLIPQARGVLAVALALGLTTVAAHGETIPTGTVTIVGLILVNFIVGLALALAIGCVFAAITGAGVLADSLSGFSFGSQIDPIFGNQGGTLTTVYSMIGMALFLAVGGDAWTLRGIDATFRVAPLAAPLSDGQLRGLIGGAEAMVGVVFLGAVEVIAPVMFAVVIADIAFGLVSRVAPQLNVYAVGFPVKIGVSLLLVGVSLPLIAGWMSGALQNAMTTFLQTI